MQYYDTHPDYCNNCKDRCQDQLNIEKERIEENHVQQDVDFVYTLCAWHHMNVGLFTKLHEWDHVFMLVPSFHWFKINHELLTTIKY